MKYIAILITIFLFNSCAKIDMHPFNNNQLEENYNHRNIRDIETFTYDGSLVLKNIFIRSGWIVDRIDIDKYHSIDGYTRILSTSIGDKGGSLHKYSLHNLDKIEVYKGQFENQLVIASIIFYYSNGNIKKAGTMQGTKNISKHTYNLKNKYIKSYTAGSYGKFLNYLRFIIQ
jgi:hypothetical protein